MENNNLVIPLYIQIIRKNCKNISLKTYREMLCGDGKEMSISNQKERRIHMIIALELLDDVLRCALLIMTT